MQSQDHDLTTKIQALESMEAVRTLKFRYLNACDDKQPERVRDCFAPGRIDINFGHIGQFDSREAFVEVFVELGCHEHIVDMHHAENMIVDLTGADSASARVGLRFHSINTRDRTSVQLGGYYLDDYVRRDGQWLITASQFLVRSALIKDFSGEFEKVVWAGNHMPT
ncbi:MAG: nuclear transport factor 2 family protein [Haliea sp.]